MHREMNALTRSTSERRRALSSPISMIHFPRRSCALSLLPRSAISSANQSGDIAMTAQAVLLNAPCGPSRISAWSALQPGRYTRATACTIQARPTARA